MSMHYVYYLLSPDDGRLLYIGRSRRPKMRLASFIKRTGIPAQLSRTPQRFSRLEDAQAAELAAIAKHWPPHNKGLQSTRGATGISRSMETRKKLSASLIGRPATRGFQGKTFSAESKQRLSEALLGRVPSFGFLGKSHSEEARAKMRGPRGPNKKKRASHA